MLAGTSQTRLAVLLGRNPSLRVIDPAATFAWPATREIGTGQPSDLLRRRLMLHGRAHDATMFSLTRAVPAASDLTDGRVPL